MSCEQGMAIRSAGGWQPGPFLRWVPLPHELALRAKAFRPLTDRMIAITEQTVSHQIGRLQYKAE
jgi:hypothetical protein